MRFIYKSHHLLLQYTERICTKNNFPISSTKLFLLRNTVHQITCSNCSQHFIGSTTRFIQDRILKRTHGQWKLLRKETSQSAKTKSTKASKRSRQLYGSKHSTYEYTNLLLTVERNVVNSLTFCSNEYFVISRETLCVLTLTYEIIFIFTLIRHSLIRSFYPFLVIFVPYYLSYIFHLVFFCFPHVFTLQLYLSLMQKFFLILDDAVDRRKLGF